MTQFFLHLRKEMSLFIVPVCATLAKVGIFPTAVSEKVTTMTEFAGVEKNSSE